jgi:hypothetical protein
MSLLDGAAVGWPIPAMPALEGDKGWQPAAQALQQQLEGWSESRLRIDIRWAGLDTSACEPNPWIWCVSTRM